MKFDKPAIKNIALNRFHDKHYDTPLDLVIYAIEVWMAENGLEIIEASQGEAAGEASSNPAKQQN